VNRLRHRMGCVVLLLCVRNPWPAPFLVPALHFISLLLLACSPAC
jgi:hypothetical protein